MGQIIKYKHEIKTISDSLKSGLPTLVSMRKQDEPDLLARIGLLIVSTCEFLGQEIKEPAVRELSRMIASDYFYFNLEDLRLAFGKLKRGEVLNYNKISPTHFYDCLREYDLERTEIVAERSKKKHHIAIQEKGDWSPELEALVKEAVKSLETKAIADTADYNKGRAERREAMYQHPEPEGLTKAREIANAYYRKMDSEIGMAATAVERAKWMKDNTIQKFITNYKI